MPETKPTITVNVGAFSDEAIRVTAQALLDCAKTAENRGDKLGREVAGILAGFAVALTHHLPEPTEPVAGLGGLN